MSVGPSSWNTSMNRLASPATSLKCTKKILPCAPQRRMSAGRSSVIKVKLPWHTVIPLYALGTVASTRSKAAGVPMIRGTPRTSGNGGSSGCRQMRTPASSATGTTARRKYSCAAQSWSVLMLPGSATGAARRMVASS
jgi:hypothetical protein